MRRRTKYTSFAGIVAGLVFAFGSVEDGALRAQNAEAGTAAPAAPAPLVEDIVPITARPPRFVSEPMVQPVPPQATEPPAAQAASLRELAAAMPVDQPLSPQLECLAGAIYFEARGESLEGQLGVARVVMNRADDRRFPGSYCDVVYQRSQFSFVRNGRMPSIPRGAATWKRAKALAQIGHRGLWKSEVGDALYFHASYVRPAWARAKQARATIETHRFYR